MARKVTTTLVDDLDGTVIESGQGETVSFGVDGAQYEIDLTNDNAGRLRDALRPFMDAARKGGRGSAAPARASSGGGAKNSPQELAAAREWLRSNGHNVSDRGRIAAPLFELYRNSK